MKAAVAMTAAFLGILNLRFHISDFRSQLLRVLFQKRDRGRPGLFGGLGIGVALGLGALEAVAGAFVDVGVVGLVELGHVFLGGGNGRIDAGVVAAVVALDGGFDV